MPFLGAPALIAGTVGAGAAGAASGGKKHRNNPADQAAAQQAANQKELIAFGKQAFGTGMTAWNPAVNYFQQLLQGGQAARVATGPSAELTREAYTGGQQQLQDMVPRGGERNLALAQSTTRESGDLSRLYSGVQPMAAQALGALSGIPIGVSPGFTGSAGTNVGASLNYYQNQQQQQQQSGAGIGQLLYSAAKKNG